MMHGHSFFVEQVIVNARTVISRECLCSVIHRLYVTRDFALLGPNPEFTKIDNRPDLNTVSCKS